MRARFSDDIDSGRPESSQLSGTQSSTMDVEDQMGEAWGSSDGDEEDEAREQCHCRRKKRSYRVVHTREQEA